MMRVHMWQLRRLVAARLLASVGAASLLGACQGLQEGDPNQSPVAVVEWTLGRVLNEDPPSLASLGPYLSEKARPQLSDFLEATAPDESMGLITLNLTEGDRWAGRYGFMKKGWPLAFSFELQRVGGFWSIKELPFSKIYKQLTQLTGPEGVPELESGEPWSGGLISFDRAGRPLGEVVLTWLPPYAFIDGVPLYGKATEEKVIEELALAFSRREQMAAQAQANYFRRVAIAMKGSSSLKEFMQVISWAEDAGGVSISIIAQTSEGEPRLIRLAQRTSTLAHGAPQRILEGRVEGEGALKLKLLDRTKSKAKSSEVIIDVSAQADSSIARSKVLGLYQQAEAGALEGAVLTPKGAATLQELARALNAFKSVDPELPIAISPYQETK